MNGYEITTQEEEDDEGAEAEALRHYCNRYKSFDTIPQKGKLGLNFCKIYQFCLT